jgi:DNA-binding beta-propeller fold protein YncE
MRKLAKILFIIISSFAFSQNHYLLALSKTDKKLVVIDYKNLKIIEKIPVGKDPHEIVTSADGKTAYVSNTGSGRLHTIDIIDLPSLKNSDSIDTYPLMGPHGLAFVKDKLWFTAQGTKTIGSYDPSSKKINQVIGSGQNRTHMLKVSKDSQHIFATNVGSGTVSIFDYNLHPPTITPMGYALPTAKPFWDWSQAIINVDPDVEGLDISADEKELWTTSPSTGKIYIIDIHSKRITKTIDAKIFGANRLKFSNEDKFVLISSLKTGELVIFDSKSKKEITRLKLGTGASEILIDKDSNNVFISCTPDNYVVVLDLKTFKIIKKIDIGGRPDGLTFAEF